MSELPDGTLMQRAAGALAGVVIRELRERVGRVYGSRVVLLIGPGSNGGDALFAGARLAARGVAVTAALVTNSTHAHGLDAFVTAGGRVIDISRQAANPFADEAGSGAALGDAGQAAAAPTGLDADTRRQLALRAGGAAGRAWTAARVKVLEADLVVDGLLGIGGRPGLTDSAARIVGTLDPRIPVIAVDVPSGINPDTGQVAGAHVNADLTVTFGTAKPGLLLPPASAAAGRIEIVDIGLDASYLGNPAVQRVCEREVAALWPVPRPTDDKYSRGVVGVVAGGSVYTGAAVLATGAAIRSGAGMVRFVGPDGVTATVRERWPEVVPGEGKVQAWVLGPGVDPDSDDDQAKVIASALAGDLPCVVDAGAIEILARQLADGAVTAPLLLTPHAGELARLLEALTDRKRVSRESVEAAPLEHARQAAELTGGTVLLKGAVTLVVSPDGAVRSQAEAPPWLATAGAGDVLAGIVGTLLASGLNPLEAGSLGAWLHGSAASEASQGGPIIADDVLRAVPATMGRLLRNR